MKLVLQQAVPFRLEGHPSLTFRITGQNCEEMSQSCACQRAFDAFASWHPHWQNASVPPAMASKMHKSLSEMLAASSWPCDWSGEWWVRRTGYNGITITQPWKTMRCLGSLPNQRWWVPCNIFLPRGQPIQMRKPPILGNIIRSSQPWRIRTTTEYHPLNACPVSSMLWYCFSLWAVVGNRTWSWARHPSIKKLALFEQQSNSWGPTQKYTRQGGKRNDLLMSNLETRHKHISAGTVLRKKKS